MMSDSMMHEQMDIKPSLDMKVFHRAPEPIHKVNQATQKTVVVVGKEHFLMCKQLMQDNATDDEFAILLNIPPDKVRYFKHKMQIFEDKIRARRRAARLNKRRNRRNRKKPEGSINRYIRKKEMSAEERFKYARQLILENFSTREISKALRVSERSVTRFRRRLNEQKRKLQEEGKLEVDPEEETEEYKFKFLSAEVKAEKIAELSDKGMGATEIAKALHISDKTVRRWRIRLDEMKANPDKYNKKYMRKEPMERPRYEPKKQYIKSLDKEVIEKAKRLFEKGETNKDMCVILGLSMNTVKKLIKMITNGTIDSLVDDTLDLLTSRGRGKITKVADHTRKKIKKEVAVKSEWDEEDNKNDDDDDDWGNDGFDDDWGGNDENKWGDDSSSDDEDDDVPLARLKKDDSFGSTKVKNERRDEFDDALFADADPLDPLSCVIIEENPGSPTATATVTPEKPKKSTPPEPKKPKSYLGEREVIISKILRERGIRTMDIAMLMNISERSASRLLQKAKDLSIDKYEKEIIDHVNELIENKEQIIDHKKATAPLFPEAKGYDDTKRRTGMRMLSMNVKPKDIAMILNVSEKTIKRWKERLDLEQAEAARTGTTSGHEIFNDLFPLKQEPVFHDIEDEEY